MSHLPSRPSADFIRRNPQLYPPPSSERVIIPTRNPRVRQSHRPQLNKLEASWLDWLMRVKLIPNESIYIQSFTLLLGNGVRYTPDFVVAHSGPSSDTTLTAYEVKGPHAREDSIIKLKLAPQKFHRVMRFVLVWREKNEWYEQEIVP